MDKPLILKRTSTSDSTFDIRYCIICQKGTLNDNDLKSLPAGRSTTQNQEKSKISPSPLKNCSL